MLQEVPFSCCLNIYIAKAYENAAVRKGENLIFCSIMPRGVNRECFLHRPFSVLCNSAIVVANVNLNKQVVLNSKVTAELALELWSGTIKQA